MLTIVFALINEGADLHRSSLICEHPILVLLSRPALLTVSRSFHGLELPTFRYTYHSVDALKQGVVYTLLSVLGTRVLQ